MHTLAAEFTGEVKQLCATTVTDRQWATFVDAHVPFLDHQRKPLNGRAKTMAKKKRARLDRVSPWAGTAYGVMQAVNHL